MGKGGRGKAGSNLQARREHEGVQDARAKEGRVLEVLPGQELNGGNPLLPDEEDGEEQEAQDQHCDNVAGSPAVGGVGGDAEGQQEEREGGGDENDAEDLENGNVSTNILICFCVSHVINRLGRQISQSNSTK